MPSNYSSLTVDWYDATDSYATTIDITTDVKSIPLFTDTGTGEVNEAKIVLRALNGRFITAVSWSTSTQYEIGDRVKQSSKFYVCLEAHTSGTFATDLAAGKWSQEADIDVHDRFRIRVTDLGGNNYDRYFEVLNAIPSQSKPEGSLLTLECLGIEYHTQHIHMARPYYFEDGFSVLNDIANFYNSNKGTDQPFLDNADLVWDGNIGSEIPSYTANNYEYGLNEDVCYNRWMDLIEKLGSSVSAGGTLTFYELSFVTTGVNAIDMRARASGSNTPTITIKNVTLTNQKTVGEQEGVVANPTGTNVLAWGSNEHGTLPVANSKYDSSVMSFLFRPEWQDGISYAVDARVKVTTNSIDKHYKCTAAHTSIEATNKPEVGAWASFWVQIDMAEEFGNVFSYSPWTDDKALAWRNSGLDARQKTTYTAGGWFDINVVINDDSGFFRTWVDARAKTNAELETLDGTDGYSYEVGDTNFFPNGFRVLVDGVGTGVLSGFDDMVVEYRRTSLNTYEWKKLYDFSAQAIDDKVKANVVVLDEGVVYEGTNFDTTPVWTALDTTSLGNDCCHPYTTAPVNDDGVDLVLENDLYVPRSGVTDSTNRPDITKAGGTFSKNLDSAIKFSANSPSITSDAYSWATGSQGDYYSKTIGCNFRFPFPVCKEGLSENVGEIYGGGGAISWSSPTPYTRGDLVINGGSWYRCLEAHTSGTFATDLANNLWILYYPEPSTLDIQNMNKTSDGLDGFNHGGSSEDLGQISAVAFWLKYSQVDLGDSKELNDEHRFMAWFIDTKDNVVSQDFVVSHSNNWEDIRLPISGFRIYRGRKPLYGFDAVTAQFFPPKELEIIDIFEWRNIKLFGIQYQGNYDKHGRYDPAGASVTEGLSSSVIWANARGVNRTLWIDSFRFIKPLLVNATTNTTREIEPDFIQRPNITLYHQLENDAKSQLEIEKFQHKEFNLETSGDDIFDLDFGESFFYENSDLVSDADNGSNNIKLVAKRIEYSITKPATGKGGLRRRIQASKVFT